MDFKTFKEEVKENVRAHLPKEAKDVELSFGTYQKMNYSYEALFINIPEKNAQVSINLDELYGKRPIRGCIEISGCCM